MTKQEVRSHFRNLRKTLTKDQIIDLSGQIAKNAVQYLPLNHGSLVHTFLPIHKNREVDTWQLIGNIREYSSSVKILISKTDFVSRRMSHFYLDENTVIIENPMGIPEPESGKEALVDNIDVIFVPLLGYDRSGNRVGYGKGYYDELLKELGCSLKAGLSFFDPVDRIENTDPHDVPLDLCITPGGVIDFR